MLHFQTAYLLNEFEKVGSQICLKLCLHICKIVLPLNLELPPRREQLVPKQNPEVMQGVALHTPRDAAL